MQAIAVVGPALASAGTSTALAVASTAVGVGGAIMEARAQRAELAYRGAIATRQAVLEEQNAAMVRQAGAVAAQDVDFENAAIMAEELATMSSRGFLTSSPSYVRRRNQQAALARRDRLRTVVDANNQAASASNRAAAARAEASQSRAGARNAGRAGILNIGSSLISGANLAGELAARRLSNEARTVS